MYKAAITDTTYAATRIPPCPHANVSYAIYIASQDGLRRLLGKRIHAMMYTKNNHAVTVEN